MPIENFNNSNQFESENHDNMWLDETKKDLLKDFQSSIPERMKNLKFNERASASNDKNDLI